MIFISYARQDFDSALRLYEDLTKTKVKPWLDKNNLLPGQNWKVEINKAIKGSEYFIALFSSTSIEKKGYTQEEFKYAINVLSKRPKGKIFVIPARLDDCEIPHRQLNNIERVDLFPDWDAGIGRIVRALHATKLRAIANPI